MIINVKNNHLQLTQIMYILNIIMKMLFKPREYILIGIKKEYLFQNVKTFLIIH